MGPKIIVRKNGSTLAWSVDSGNGDVPQIAGGSAFKSGQIRSDFVGSTIDTFTVMSGGMTCSNANYVVFETDVGGQAYTVEMVRTAGDRIRWYVTKDGQRKLLTPMSFYNVDEVPAEFTGTVTSFREIVEGVDLDEIDWFQVE